MPCFTGTTLANIISTLYLRINCCSIIFYLGPIALHTLFILIGLQLPHEKCFPPINTPEALMKNSLYGTYAVIDGSVPSRECSVLTHIAEAQGLINLFTMAPC